jgi:hypothetical protein
MPDILHLQQADWCADFDPGALRRGQDYARRGFSRLLSLKDHSLLANCQGSTARPYQQRITLHPTAQRWDVTGHCSCPVGYNCKHVVAALLTLETLQNSGRGMAALVVTEKPLEETLLEQAVPIPVLTLGSHLRMHFNARKGRMLEQAQHRAALAFNYQGHTATGRETKDLLIRIEQTRQLRIVRQAQAENMLRQRLEKSGLRSALRQSDALSGHPGEHFEHASDNAWIKFMQEQVPVLREEGWHIEILPSFQFNLARVDNWYAEVDDAPEQGWFDLELGIEVQGRRISLLPILLQSIRSMPGLLSGAALAQRHDEEHLLVALPESEHQIALPYARLRPLLAALGELFAPELESIGSRIRLARADATCLHNLEQGPALNWQGDKSIRDFAKRLRNSTEQTIAAPSALAAQLRPYQLHGLGWMQALRELRMGGVLADDMGLGKTLQTLAHILLEKQQERLQYPALIVMPTSLVPNWQDESARFAPSLRVLTLHGSKRRERFHTLGEYDIVLSTYALLPRDIKFLAEQPFHLLILDEAQSIKNPRSKAALAAGQINAAQRLCLSGTPLENHLGELWSLFNFLMPGWLGDSTHFSRNYRTPIEKHGNQQRLQHLSGRIKPFVLRRKKEQVARELPPKSEMTQWVELSTVQRDRYETLRLAMDRKVRDEIARQGLARSQIVILEALLRLRQACCDLRLLKDAPQGLTSHDSGKLRTLLDMLESLIDEGRRVLLFSQFTSMLSLIETELQARDIRYAKLTGNTRDRRTPVQQFQAGEFPVFLISLKAGGSGLNLTAADTVIHFDPWWNPAAEAQASDRAYRIGQDKPVFVYRMIAKGSVEEKIQQLQQSKAGLAKGLLEGGSQTQWQLSEADLQALFAPLSG